jgi:hypothetical protein
MIGVITRFGTDCLRLHYDSTSVSVHGAYLGAVKRDFPAEQINVKWYGDGTDIESDTIGDQHGVYRQADFFGEISSTGSSASPRRRPPVSAGLPV